MGRVHKIVNGFRPSIEPPLGLSCRLIDPWLTFYPSVAIIRGRWNKAGDFKLNIDWRVGNTVNVSCVLFAVFCWGTPAQIEAPQPVIPQNGRSRELPPGRSDIEFVWTSVEDATGYLITIAGPPAFPGFLNVAIDPATPTVSRSFLGFVPGDYEWEVRATGLGAISSATPFHFTVPAPLPTGGDLPPPALFAPPDYSIFRGRRGGTVMFQWSTVPGATGYRLEVQAFENAGTFFANPSQAVEAGTVRQEVSFVPPPNAIAIFTWRVIPIDATGEGTPSRDAHLLFAAGDLEAEDILFVETLGWQSSGFRMDANGDNLTNAIDLTVALPFQKEGKVLTAGQNGPNLIGQFIDTSGATLAWRTLGGVDSYEVNILDASGNFDSTFLSYPVGGTENQTLRVSPAPLAGDYRWRVRGFFGFDLDASPYSNEGSFTILEFSR
jgi:hypothetical protein